jgi:hypothetical protein
VNDFLGIALLVDEAVTLVEQVVKIAENGAEVFAGGDGAPSTDRVERTATAPSGSREGISSAITA